jgi:hypothetical protein
MDSAPAIRKAVAELIQTEPILHTYAIPSAKDIYDHFNKGTQFGKFRSNKFPIAEEFLREVGALDWFMDENDPEKIVYGVTRINDCLPTMNLKVLSRIPIGQQNVYDIQVDDVHSFLGNGIVSHNCFIAHGTSKFQKERFMDSSDLFSVYVSKKEEAIIVANPEKRIFKFDGQNLKDDEVVEMQLPYAMKLLWQEMESMGIDVRTQMIYISHIRSLIN